MLNNGTMDLYGYSSRNKFNENDPKYFCCCGLHLTKACFIIGIVDFFRRMFICLVSITSCYLISCNDGIVQEDGQKSISLKQHGGSRIVLEWGVVLTGILTLASLFSSLMLLVSLTSYSIRQAMSHLTLTIIWLLYEPFFAYWILVTSHGCPMLIFTGSLYAVYFWVDLLFLRLLYRSVRYFQDKRRANGKVATVIYQRALGGHVYGYSNPLYDYSDSDNERSTQNRNVNEEQRRHREMFILKNIEDCEK